MEKESYNIDDILSEVKKRREEHEIALKQGSGEEQEPEEKPSIKEDEIQKQAEVLPEDEDSFELTEEPPVKEEYDFEEIIISNDEEEKNQETEALPQDKPEEEPIVITEEAEDTEESSDMVDILQIARAQEEQLISPAEEKPHKEKFFHTKKGKIVKAVIIILVIAVVAAGIIAAIFINKMLNGVSDNDGDSYKAVEYYDGMDFLQEDFPMIEELSAYDVYSYKEYLKSWYQNGDPVRSSHVLNILLIGEDTREEEITDTSRADSAIIASINVDTGTIYLTSILRDLYVYYEIDGEGYYGKINEAASTGGMNTYINTIERYYKISIDNYAVVNFASFPKIIDALGGVEVAITDAEVYEVNNNPIRYANATLPQAQYDAEGNPAKVVLSGEQALAFCRIRKIDSDNARADRQKTVLSELLTEVKGSGTLDAVKVVNQLSQYTKTGYTKKELISIGNLALKDGWLNFNIETINVPTTENSTGGQNFSVAPGNWIWIADIPKDAYELQMFIYGKSNIQLNENRPDYISMGK
ncbi:MAG: LCP family protein [Eubacterium sp.]